MSRDLETAQHEAAHIVVGVALGERLQEAVLHDEPDEHGYEGYAWFPDASGLAYSLILAAGLAWERRAGDVTRASGDVVLLRAEGRKRGDVRALELAAWAILVERREAHALVTRALMLRNLRGADIARLIRQANPPRSRKEGVRRSPTRA